MDVKLDWLKTMKCLTCETEVATAKATQIVSYERKADGTIAEYFEGYMCKLCTEVQRDITSLGKDE